MGQAINAQVVIGDHNVVLRVDGRDLVEVPVPDTVEQARRLVFAGDGPRSSRWVSSWLLPQAGVVVEVPRAEAVELATWCETVGEPVVRLVRGAGGQGKTFLARQVCGDLRERGWVAGIVAMPPVNWQTATVADVTGARGTRAWAALRRVPELVAGVRALVALRVRALLVVDYAEHLTPMVAELLDTVLADQGQDRMRILLLARSDVGWWRELSEEHPQHSWVDPLPVTLQSMDADWTPDRVAEVWGGAVKAFFVHAVRHRLTAHAPAPGHPLPDRFATTLDLYAHALLTVLTPDNGAGGGGRASDAEQALAGVLAHEHRQISAVLHGAGIPLTESQRDWAIAATILRPAPDLEAAAAALRCAPALAALDDKTSAAIAEILGRVYADPDGHGVWVAPRPDRLADTHLLRMAQSAAGDQQWINAVRAVCGGGDADLAIADTAGVALHRCLSTPGSETSYALGLARISAALRALIRHHPRSYVPVMTVVDPEGCTDDIIAAVEDSALRPSDIERFASQLGHMGFATTRTRIAAAVVQRLVSALRCAADADGGSGARNRLARSLNDLSIRLAQVGRREEGLAAIEEAVTIWRRLAGANPVAYLPELAAALNNLSVLLGEFGRSEEGLAVSEEAAEAYRRLASANPAPHLSGLAAALNNLSVRLAELGRHEEGLAVSEEAGGVYRRLADADPAAHLPDLAGSLNSLSNRLAGMGRHQEGLVAIEEAVRIRRDLAGADPAAHLPDFAMALNSLSIRLGEVGRHEEGLAVCEEAVRMRRRLADANPAAYLPDLAAALSNHSVLLAGVGRVEDGIAAGEEAVRIRRRLAETNPAAHLPHLATALNNLSVFLGEAGRNAEGRAACEEAVRIRRRLAEASPAAYLSELADALNNLAIRLDRRSPERLAAVEEAVGTYRRLAEGSPAVCSPEFGRVLRNLSNALFEAGRRDEGLAALEEAVTLQRHAAATNPAAHLPALADSLLDLSTHLGEVGRRADALAVTEEAADAYRRLAGEQSAVHLRLFAIALNNRSVLLGEAGRHEESLAAIEEAVLVQRRLLNADPAADLPEFEAFLANLANRLTALGRHGDAARVREEAVSRSGGA